MENVFPVHMLNNNFILLPALVIFLFRLFHKLDWRAISQNWVTALPYVLSLVSLHQNNGTDTCFKRKNHTLVIEIKAQRYLES